MFPNLTEHASGVHVLSAVGPGEGGTGPSEPQGTGRGLAPGRETDAGFDRKLLRDRSAQRLLGLCPLTEEQ